MKRCLNDYFGYCYGNPNPVTHEETDTVVDLGGKPKNVPHSITTCSNNTRTCSHYLTHSRLHQFLTHQTV